MTKVILISFFLFISCSCFSQINHIQILVGKTDWEVNEYLDSLNKLKNNPYYKVEKDISEDGAVILKSSFSISDAPYYKCTYIATRFKRVNGEEVCVRQIVMGDSEYAQYNLSFVKDNFTFVRENVWEKLYEAGSNLKTMAFFERTDGEYPKYVITYEFRNLK